MPLELKNFPSMKFSELPYNRPSFEDADKLLKNLVDQSKNAEAADAQIAAIDQYNDFWSDIFTYRSIANINHDLNTKDEYYHEEVKYYNETMPQLISTSTQFDGSLISSPFRSDLEQEFGSQYFKSTEVFLKVNDPKITEALIEESRLIAEYGKFMAELTIPFEGKDLPSAALYPYMISPDRDVRKRAKLARSKAMEESAPVLDEIFTKLVKLRHQMAMDLGFKNFSEMAYYRMGRTDYNMDDVQQFIDAIHKYAVPLHQKLYERRRKRLGLEKLYYYDGIDFKDGDPKPKGGHDDILAAASQMYEELSPETHEFFQMMLDKELMDLKNRTAKSPGGYCATISKYYYPFILANFNGTAGDVDVLTHEVGHAFQKYLSRDVAKRVKSYMHPTAETAEIHSMAMELFTWNWYELFFKEDAEKYRFSKMASAVNGMPWGGVGEEFQRWVYDNPNATAEERNAQMRKIEIKYNPHKADDDYYDGDTYSASGGGWQYIGHFFFGPFYWIDYQLAQTCALQFWNKMNEDFDTAWQDYIKLCKAGGSKSYFELLKVGKLKSPFEPDAVKEVMASVENWLDKIDDSSF